MKVKNYNKAAEYLDLLLLGYSKDILADDALYKLAELNELRLNSREKAKEMYQRLLTEFPGSLYTVEARKRFRKLRGDTPN